MSDFGVDALTAWSTVTIVCFCRIGGVVMVLPGLSSARISARFRVAVAMAIALAVVPLVEPQIRPAIADASYAQLALLVTTETGIGLSLGFLVRVFFVALQFAAVVVGSLLGLAIGGPAISDDAEGAPPPTDILLLTATVLFFVSDLHVDVLTVVVNSFALMPPGDHFPAEASFARLLLAIGDAFALALRMCAAFMAYAIFINFVLGLANRMVPMLPIQFLAGPAVLGGGLVLLGLISHGVLEQFMIGVGRWISRG